MSDFILWVCTAAIVAIIALVFYTAWIEATSPTFELRKDQWECVEYRDYVTFVPSGKVLIPINHHECQQWVRR